MYVKKDIFDQAKKQKPSEEYKNSIAPWANVKILIGSVILVAFIGFVVYAVFFFEG